MKSGCPSACSLGFGGNPDHRPSVARVSTSRNGRPFALQHALAIWSRRRVRALSKLRWVMIEAGFGLVAVAWLALDKTFERLAQARCRISRRPSEYIRDILVDHAAD